MKPPYRILHLIDHLGPGGAQEALLNLVKYHDRRHFELEVAAMHGFGVYWDLLGRQGVRCHSLSPHKFLPLYVPNLLRLLGRGRFQVVHCHLIAANLIAKPLAVLAGVPVLFNHDQCNDIFRYRRRARLWLDRLANRWTAQIIAVSDSTRNFLLHREHIDPAKVALIYNAVDLERYAPVSEAQRRHCRRKFNLADSDFVVLGAGRLKPQKNFPGFLETAALLSRRHPEARFIIAGDGPDRADLLKLARSLGLGERVALPGFVSDMADLYRASDVLFFPSWFEGTPMAVLEAMASGLPIVASRIDGTAEILTDGVDAFLAPPDQTQVFARRLADLLREPALARRLAANALAKVQEHFAAPVMVRRVEALYLERLTEAWERREGF